jgi:hypothetical protein
VCVCVCVYIYIYMCVCVCVCETTVMVENIGPEISTDLHIFSTPEYENMVLVMPSGCQYVCIYVRFVST